MNDFVKIVRSCKKTFFNRCFNALEKKIDEHVLLFPYTIITIQILYVLCSRRNTGFLI
jgi:hypothetical protein